MRHQVNLPKLGEAMQSALITEWLCSVGDHVGVGAPLVTVETDKITTDVEAPVAGTLVEQLVSVQDEVPVGTAICVLETDEG